MRIAKAEHKILTEISNPLALMEVSDSPGVMAYGYCPGYSERRAIERAARICYKSEELSTKSIASADRLIKKLIASGHEAMLEHGCLSVWFECDRAVSHELVRHRMASFAQESQRYCNYSKEKFETNVTFIQPWWLEPEDMGYSEWKDACLEAEMKYFKLLEDGYLPQQARMVLPNCTKTELVVTANYREWRHILKLRTAKDAHPDMRHLMAGLLRELHERLPVIFDDIRAEEVAK